MIVLARFAREFRNGPAHRDDGGAVADGSIDGVEQIAEAIRGGFDEEDRGFRRDGVSPFDVPLSPDAARNATPVGGGLSTREFEPLFQSAYAIPDDPRGHRGAPDVSYNANPSTGFAVYDSVALSGSSGWFCVGGTSAGSPQWAALLAISNSMRVANRKSRLSGANTVLYSLSKKSAATNFHPINSGTNGSCGALCTARAGYDYFTGIGTPVAASLINNPGRAVARSELSNRI